MCTCSCFYLYMLRVLCSSRLGRPLSFAPTTHAPAFLLYSSPPSLPLLISVALAFFLQLWYTGACGPVFFFSPPTLSPLFLVWVEKCIRPVLPSDMGSILDQYPPLNCWKNKNKKSERDASLLFSLQKPPFLLERRKRAQIPEIVCQHRHGNHRCQPWHGSCIVWDPDIR